MDGGIILLIIFLFVITLKLLRLLPRWLEHREEMARAKKPQEDKDRADQAEVNKLKERLENLEALMCRLDSEMNSQFERSYSILRTMSPSAIPGNSQTPTSFLNIASALESRYQILQELGRGGMGIVFQAHDKQLNEQVAIKILSPIFGSDPEALERLKREVSSARRVTHPNVIRIHDLSELSGLHFVSMEYFQGMNLHDYIKKTGALSLMQGFNIASQICDGLEAAHAQGVIHRDLKSQNIIVGLNNLVKIIDFGLARSSQMEGMTATGLIMGTPEYMSPEQVGGKHVDERTDIYSLGIILYEIFGGCVPFSGGSAIAIGFKQLKEEPPSLREINPQISQEVSDVILKCLRKDPMQRYRNVQELRTDLEKAVLRPTPPVSLPSQLNEKEEVKVKQG